MHRRGGLKSTYGLAYHVLRDRLLKENPLHVDFLMTMDEKDVLVIPGHHDHMSYVLDALKVPYSTVKMREVATFAETNQLVAKSTVLFVNCGEFHMDARTTEWMRTFVSDGALMLSTDWALTTVVQHCFPDMLGLIPQDTRDDVVGVLPVDNCEDDVTECLRGEESAPVWWLEVGSYLLEAQSPLVEVLVRSDEMMEKYGSDIVLCKFPWGSGVVYHMVSHAFIQRVRNGVGEVDPEKISAYLISKGANEMTAQEIIKAHRGNFAQIQSCLTSLELMTRLILKQKVRCFGSVREDRAGFLDGEVLEENEEMQAFQEALRNPSGLQEIKEQCVNLVSASLINEPKFFDTADANRQRICDSLKSVCEHGDPEFLLKLATYVRQRLNIRSTANFILAVAGALPPCHQFFPKYFSQATRLPSDMIEIVELYGLLPATLFEIDAVSPRLPSVLKKAVARKFATFSEFQLAKYNKKTHKKAGAPRAPLSLKSLVRVCHLSEPRMAVMKLLGKKYPSSQEEFERCRLPGDFDPSLSGVRMRLDVPETWETALSTKGSSWTVWEELVHNDKLPIMALMRNLRNLMQAGVEEECHQQVLELLGTCRVIEKSRMLPTQFLSAYRSVAVCRGELEKWARNLSIMGEGQQLPSRKEIRRARGSIAASSRRAVLYDAARRGRRRGASLKLPFIRDHNIPIPENVKALLRANSDKTQKIVVPHQLPSPELVAQYENVLSHAAEMACRKNLGSLPGRVLCLLDISGSMLAPCSSFRSVGSSSRLLDAGAMLACLIDSACTGECQIRLFGSPQEQGGRCDELFPGFEESDGDCGGLLKRVESLVSFAEKSSLGRGTDFPFTLMRDLIDTNQHVDFLIVISDMTVVGDNRVAIRNAVDAVRSSGDSASMAFVVIDLHAGSSKRPMRPSEMNDSRDIFLAGFSDTLIRYISAHGLSPAEDVDRIDGELSSMC